MIFEMNLNPEPFEKIACGEKTIELRLYDQKRSRLNIGDLIIFTNASNQNCRIAVIIKALHRYDSFIELFSAISPKSCGYPENTTPEEAVSSIRKYYSEKREKEYGVIGIKIDLVELETVLPLLEKTRRGD